MAEGFIDHLPGPGIGPGVKGDASFGSVLSASPFTVVNSLCHVLCLSFRKCIHCMRDYGLCLVSTFSESLLFDGRHFKHQWSQGAASWWIAEEESDRISMKKTNCIKSALLPFLKVCQFYQISLFRQLNIVFHKISKNHFFKDCILNFT